MILCAIGFVNIILVMTLWGVSIAVALSLVALVIALPTLVNRTGIYRYDRRDMVRFHFGLGLAAIPLAILVLLLLVATLA